MSLNPDMLTAGAVASATTTAVSDVIVPSCALAAPPARQAVAAAIASAKAGFIQNLAAARIVFVFK
jgi:hypothetical protein